MACLPPLITDTSRPFWDALKNRRISIQRCDACTKWVFYPRRFCPGCGSTHLSWREVSGEATLYMFTLAVLPVSEDFMDAGPQLLAVAELIEGIRLPTTLVELEPDCVKIGMSLEPVFDEATLGDITLLRFRAGKHSR